jgi:hypothetical protein
MPFEKIPLYQLLADMAPAQELAMPDNQLILL